MATLDKDADLSRRIAACLKACDGIPTEKLESGVIVRLVAACVHVSDPDVRAVIDELTPRHERSLPLPRPRPQP